MPITKTYINKKTVAQVRAIANRKKIATKGKTKAQMVTAILKKVKPAKSKTTMKDGPVKGIYATKKDAQSGKYIIAYKLNNSIGKTSVTIGGVQKYKRSMQAFKDRNMRKVPFGNLKLMK